ncbi:NAD(P)-binding domain-containing protein [Pseudofrankia asymbiotica]|uniref:6-phosphogluconate dehydrogenase NADP-binding domain-containing protein n=1 Tax=Pseudofrankia asymbiotica TaxID=1834516 RepID=A0A1V2I5L7_9ACTN|nr:NAD(P)-binding domain-containing protein [Pseudofrankia asymbiotica]ONH26413.1 hypothetical protein BL253_24845 [Pseudofrankia asymbiotica]
MGVGFTGLGAMGSGMAANIQKAGYDFTVNDARPEAAGEYLERGARWAATPREVAAESDVVFTSLPTSAIVELVTDGPDGLAEGLRPSTAWFDLTTNSVDVVRKLPS